MGGNAFTYVCPRMPPAVYLSLKKRIVPRLQELYRYAAVPIEAPEKENYGDLDIVVSEPIDAAFRAEGLVNVPHSFVQHSLGATDFIGMAGPHTVSFAVPISQGEWGEHAAEEKEKRLEITGSEDGQIHYQVDVNVCSNKQEWERVVFFHSHGDTGMILGSMANCHGLHLGEKGIKLNNPPNPPFQLSDDFTAIREFLHLSDAWRTPFETNQALFSWLSTCRLFNPLNYNPLKPSKVKDTRTLYHNFVKWAHEQPVIHKEVSSADMIDEALIFFDKRDSFLELSKARALRAGLKAAWNGSVVNDWASLNGDWRGVKRLMDSVREQLGGDEGVMRLFQEEGIEKLKQTVIQMKSTLEKQGEQ